MGDGNLLFLGLLAWQSGGAFSELCAVLATLPFVAALVARPRSTLWLAGLVVAVYVIAAEAPTGAPQRGYLASEALLLGWGGSLAVLLSLVITSASCSSLPWSARRLDDTQSATERERLPRVADVIGALPRLGHLRDAIATTLLRSAVLTERLDPLLLVHQPAPPRLRWAVATTRRRATTPLP